MTADDSLAAGAVGALRDGLAAAKREGATSVHASHLTPEQLEALTASTLAHLRSLPGKPTPIEGWTLVTAQAAGVLSWWTQVAGLNGSERRRLRSLRHEVYDVLAAQNDPDAASRATVFAVVEITLLDRPVSRAAFLGDERLAEAEVIRDPAGPNPGILSPSEVEALSEHLTSLHGLSEPQVA